MKSILITGGKPLKGTIPISGAKNASLPIIASSLLTDEPLILENVPNLSDVQQIIELLANHGTTVNYDKGNNTYTFKTLKITNFIAPYEIVSKMRASILVLGPLLARHGKARVSLPGGCAIGVRPVQVHIDGLRALGATIDLDSGYINGRTNKEGLVGTEITLPIASVTGTENILMAAVLAKGKTTIRNAAMEPEVRDLILCLKKMGAKIEGTGTNVLEIEGVEYLTGTKHYVIPDRIEAASYAIAAAITNGELELKNVIFDDLSCFWNTLEKAGMHITQQLKEDNSSYSNVHLKMDSDLKGVDIITEPFPGFPTDLQAQFMALMCTCNGAAMITETIFENRFMHVLELCRMGANITVHNASALVRGVKELIGAQVMATDLRASMSLILAGLAARGDTLVQRVYHIDRGYESIEQKLQACGAIIERVAAT